MKTVKNAWNSDLSFKKFLFFFVGKKMRKSGSRHSTYKIFDCFFFALLRTSISKIEHNTRERERDYHEKEKKMNENRYVYRILISKCIVHKQFYYSVENPGENWIFNLKWNLKNVMRYCRVSWYGELNFEYHQPLLNSNFSLFLLTIFWKKNRIINILSAYFFKAALRKKFIHTKKRTNKCTNKQKTPIAFKGVKSKKNIAILKSLGLSLMGVII